MNCRYTHNTFHIAFLICFRDLLVLFYKNEVSRGIRRTRLNREVTTMAELLPRNMLVFCIWENINGIKTICLQNHPDKKINWLNPHPKPSYDIQWLIWDEALHLLMIAFSEVLEMNTSLNFVIVQMLLCIQELFQAGLSFEYQHRSWCLKQIIDSCYSILVKIISGNSPNYWTTRLATPYTIASRWCNEMQPWIYENTQMWANWLIS